MRIIGAKAPRAFFRNGASNTIRSSEEAISGSDPFWAAGNFMETELRLRKSLAQPGCRGASFLRHRQNDFALPHVKVR